MADDRRYGRPAPEIDDAPVETKRSGCDGDVVPLQAMAEAERGARDDEPDERAAK